MNMIYCYKEYDLTKVNKYLIENNNMDYELKDVLKYLEDKSISVLTKNLYITYTNGYMNIYKYLGSFKKIHLIDFDGENVLDSEEYREVIDTNNFTNSDVEALSTEIVKNSLSFSLFTYFLLKDNNFEKYTRSSKDYKVIKSDDYIQVKFKKLPVEIKIYDKVEGFCKYEINDNIAKITSNSLLQDIKTVPSPLYPLVSNDFKVFTSENTYDLEDDKIGKLLSDLEVIIGGCYTNSTNIMKILKENNINAKYYSGWILRIDRMVHHAWVVIDDKHLIDMSILKKEDDLIDLEMSNKVPKNFDIINTLSKLIEEKIPFKDKYHYGKTSRYALYIGSETNPNEARKSFNDLIKKYPNHPDYQNVDENGVNRTQRALYKKIYNKDI